MDNVRQVGSPFEATGQRYVHRLAVSSRSVLAVTSG
jgi:hypothetical protein